MTVRPDGTEVELETLGDVVQMLNPKEVRRRGVEEKIFTENGLMISAVAAGLRARGYEVKQRITRLLGDAHALADAGELGAAIETASAAYDDWTEAGCPDKEEETH